MSKLTLCSVFVVLCAFQYVCAKPNWEPDTFVQQQTFDQETPLHILSRHERSSNSRKPDSKTMRSLRKNTRASSNPCKCSGNSCTCCGTFTIEGNTEKGCSTFEIPNGRTRNSMVRYNFNFNNGVVRAQAPAGRDPQGICQPYPGFRNTEVCSRYHSTTVEDGKVRFCLVMEARYRGYTFYQMDFNCVTYDVQNQQQVGTK